MHFEENLSENISVLEVSFQQIIVRIKNANISNYLTNWTMLYILIYLQKKKKAQNKKKNSEETRSRRKKKSSPISIQVH